MQTLYSSLNPVAFSIGGFAIYWYSIAYIVGIIGGLKYLSYISRKFNLPFTNEQQEAFLTWAILGIVIGGRLGYVLIYDPIKYFNHPLTILNTREGGMSFHGGMTGIIIANYFFCNKYKLNFLELNDLLATVSPIGLFLGRIANFVNGELYGRITSMPWGVVFDENGDKRHPSQLYEAFLEGFVIFVILTYLTFKQNTIKIRMLNSGLLLTLYAIFRIFCEFFREPDFHIGYFSGFTMGQILSLPLLFSGIYLIFKSSSKLADVSRN